MLVDLEAVPPGTPKRISRSVVDVGLVVSSLLVEIGKTEATCVICSGVIRRETYRIVVQVDLRNLMNELIRVGVPAGGFLGDQQVLSRVWAHMGCLGDQVTPMLLRTGLDCWDCGRPPSSGSVTTTGTTATTTGSGRHEVRAVVSGRHAAVPLCLKCSLQPHWVRCRACGLAYSPHMVSPIVVVPTLVSDLFSQWVSQPELEVGDPLCDTCTLRFGVITQRVKDIHHEQWEQERQALLEGGLRLVESEEPDD